MLLGAGAGEVAAHHVADGVAAGLPGGEAHRASSRITSGTRSSGTKWNWMFWRVVMWPQPREYSSAMWAEQVELLGGDAAVGDA